MNVGALNLTVHEVVEHTPLIREYRLRRVDGQALPPYEPGAHLRVQVEIGGQQQWRHYSLMHLGETRTIPSSPLEYRISIRLEAQGRGGSLALHASLQPGVRLSATVPVNAFRLHEGEGTALLLAGGIGITPLLSMAAQLTASNRPFVLHYSGRSRDQLALVPELRALCPERLHVHADDEPANALDLHRLVSTAPLDAVLYVCGPPGLITAAAALWQSMGRAPDRVRVESFSEAAAASGDQPFDVVLKRSGRSLSVAADQTLLDALIENGIDVLYDCKRGECGLCVCEFVEGEVDHRDHCLTPNERDLQRKMQPCVSRASGARLVLDL